LAHRLVFDYRLRNALGGVLLTLMILISVAHGFFPNFPILPAGLLAWSAGFLLWHRLARRQRIQAAWLVSLGMLGLIWGALHGSAIDPERVLTPNHALISLLVAVTFLRLVTLPEQPRETEPLPRGRAALWKTLAGVHLFDSVINLSTVFILGDRIATRGRLGRRRALMLTRGFAAAAFWSPFFAAMAAALTYAPGAEIHELLVAGLPMAALSLWLTGRELEPSGPARGAPFVGYPLQLSTLWLPCLLITIVIVSHVFNPRWPILAVITLSAPLVSLTTLLARHGTAALSRLGEHISSRLAETANELCLFLAAGVLASGLTSTLSTVGNWLLFTSFGPLQASLLLLLMVGLSAFGLHPVISIATFGSWLAPIHPHPTLLAMTFLMAWAIGILANPLSGLHLAMQGRYGIDGYAFLRWNSVYVMKSLGIAVLILHLYSFLHRHLI
jgi:hypothetical protein